MALLQVKAFPEATVVTVNARSLCESNAAEFAQELSALANRMGGRALHLDLGEVQLLTSTGLGKLVCLYKQVRAVGGRLSLRNVRREVYEVFVVTHLHGLLDVRAAEEDGGPLSASA